MEAAKRGEYILVHHIVNWAAEGEEKPGAKKSAAGGMDMMRNTAGLKSGKASGVSGNIVD